MGNEKEEKLEVDFGLRSYQEEAVKEIEEIFINKQRRVASVMMPTGAGKSFVAMQAILRIGQEDSYLEKENTGIVNDSKIVYIAPTNEILFQTKWNIANSILKLDVEQMKASDIEKAVEKAFPNLKFVCYQSISQGENIDNTEKIEELKDADMFVVDEVQTSGAPTFQKGIAQLLGVKVENDIPVSNPEENSQNSKVLLLSATPERDVDGKNMMDLWAKSVDGLSDEQIKNREHMAIQLTLQDAINKGYVIEPEVIHFEANLADTKQYQTLLKEYRNSLLPNSGFNRKQRDALEQILIKIDEEVLGIPGYHTMSKEEAENTKFEKNLEIIGRALEEGKIDSNGKIIIFVPHRPKGSKIEIKEHYDKYQEKIKAFFEKNGIEVDFEVHIEKDENKSARLNAEHTDRENSEILNAFNNLNKTRKLSFIMGSDKLTTGVHVKGISGSIMERRIAEVENTNLRAQSIMFLQCVGRTIFSLPEKEEERKKIKKPVIFDTACNFFTQNVDNPNAELHGIKMFQLTDTQRNFLDYYNKALSQLPDKNIINVIPKIVTISEILSKYGLRINNNTVKLQDNLEDLINKLTDENREKAIQELKDVYLYNKNFKFGSKLNDAKKSFWKGTKAFEDYSIQQLQECGVIDIYTLTGRDEFKKYTDSRGFIISNASEKFIGLNIMTGTEYDLDRKDFDGFYIDEFNSETGRNSEGFNREGFNEKGIHKDTGTIHNKNGFMANGKNILTGEEYDLAGYNIDGIKPFYNKNGELVGGFDRDHLFHPYDNDKSIFRKIPTGKLAPYDEKTNIDEYGFISGRKKNIYTNSEITYTGFMNNGINFYTDGEYGSDEYDIDGYDKYGFNIYGIHRETGTRFDPEGNKSISIQDIDLYGFTRMDYIVLGGGRKNKFGFTKKEIQNIKMSAELRPGFENSVYKRYRWANVNILGTDKSGHVVDDVTGKITEQLHPSLKIAKDFISKYIGSDISYKEICEDYALENKLLVCEASDEIKKYMQQAFILYRICPELTKIKEARECMNIIYNAKDDKKIEFLFTKVIPNGKKAIKDDRTQLSKTIQEIEYKMQDEYDQRRLTGLRKRRDALKIRLKGLGKIPTIDNGK